MSALNLDLVQTEGRIGLICSFVRVGMCMHSGRHSSKTESTSAPLSFPTVAYKALRPKSGEENLKA